MQAVGTRVLYVTGKGGVGKSFVARLVADCAAGRGLRAALVEIGDGVDGRDQRARDPDRATPRYARITLNHDRALRHLLTRLLRFRFLSNRLMDSRTFSAVATAAPGIRELVYVSYLRDLAAGLAGLRHDLIVVDGLASGHSLPLLATPRRVHELVRMSPAARIAADAETFVHDGENFHAVVVTSPEELSVAETIELSAALDDLGIHQTRPVVNGVYPSCATHEQAAWLFDERASLDSLLYLARRERQLELAGRLARERRQPLVVPFLFDRHEPDDDVVGPLFEGLLAGGG